MTEKYADTLDLCVVCSSPSTIEPIGFGDIATSNSASGSRKELTEVLNLVAEKCIKLWVGILPMGEKGSNTVLERIEKGDFR